LLCKEKRCSFFPQGEADRGKAVFFWGGGGGFFFWLGGKTVSIRKKKKVNISQKGGKSLIRKGFLGFQNCKGGKKKKGGVSPFEKKSCALNQGKGHGARETRKEKKGPGPSIKEDREEGRSFNILRENHKKEEKG